MHQRGIIDLRDLLDPIHLMDLVDFRDLWEFVHTRSWAALWAADLDWIVGQEHFGVFSKSRFMPTALSSD